MRGTRHHTRGRCGVSRSPKASTALLFLRRRRRRRDCRRRGRCSRRCGGRLCLRRRGGSGCCRGRRRLGGGRRRGRRRWRLGRRHGLRRRPCGVHGDAVERLSRLSVQALGEQAPAPVERRFHLRETGFLDRIEDEWPARAHGLYREPLECSALPRRALGGAYVSNLPGRQRLRPRRAGQCHGPKCSGCSAQNATLHCDLPCSLLRTACHKLRGRAFALNSLPGRACSKKLSDAPPGRPRAS